MRKMIGLLAIAASACASPGDIYSSEVDVAEQSAKPVSEVSQCLQLRWAEAPITAPDGKIGFPMRNNYGQVLGLLTLTPNEGGTLLEMRKTGQLMIGGNNWRNCV